jgi:magnesium-transporting ATPase (P-type)
MGLRGEEGLGYPQLRPKSYYGNVEDLSESQKKGILDIIDNYAHKSLRTIGMVYKVPTINSDAPLTSSRWPTPGTR